MRSPLIDGFVLVDKPAGITSHDVIARVRRALGEKRVGHLGTLDPFATGLLVVLVGRATRLARYVPGEPKVYRAMIRFGTETTTDDATGSVSNTAPPPTLDRVRRAMDSLTGSLSQTPPAFSAKQVDGVRAYRAARAGAAIPLPAAPVVVHRWLASEWNDDTLAATVECSGGTYIRALARDLGRACESAAHLTALRRVRSGPFTVDDAVAVDVDDMRAHLRPAIEAVCSLPRVSLLEREEHDVAHGRALPADDGESIAAALVDGRGALVAVAEREGREWAPRVVMRDA